MGTEIIMTSIAREVSDDALVTPFYLDMVCSIARKAAL